MKTFSFVNQKGGAGKTTSVANVGVCFAAQGKRVLLVDMDPQGSLTEVCFGIDTDGLATMKEVLAGEDPIEEAVIKHTITEGLSLDILPADIALAPMELQLAMSFNSPKLLRKALASIADGYDYCLIDCPPALGHLLAQSLTASDYAIITANPSKSALKGIEALGSTIEAVRESSNPDLQILGLLFNRFSPLRKVDQKKLLEGEEKMADLGSRVFKTKIRSATKVEESNDERIPIVLYDMSSNPARDYIAFVNELLAEGY